MIIVSMSITSITSSNSPTIAASASRKITETTTMTRRLTLRMPRKLSAISSLTLASLDERALPADYSDVCLEASSILATRSVFAHWTASSTSGRTSRPAAASA